MAALGIAGILASLYDNYWNRQTIEGANRRSEDRLNRGMGMWQDELGRATYGNLLGQAGWDFPFSYGGETYGGGIHGPARVGDATSFTRDPTTGEVSQGGVWDIAPQRGGVNLDELFGWSGPTVGQTVRGELGKFQPIDFLGDFQPLVTDPNVAGPNMDLSQFEFDPSVLAALGQDIGAQLGRAGEGIQAGLGRAGELAGSTASSSLQQIGQGLTGGRLAPGELFGQVDYPEFEGEAQQATRLSQLQQQSGARAAMNRQQLTGGQLAAGRSLEEVGGQLQQLEFGEDVARARQAAGIESDIEGQELQHGLARGALEGQLASTEGQINSALDRAMAQARSQITGQQMATQGQLSVAASQRQQEIAQAIADAQQETGTRGQELLAQNLSELLRESGLREGQRIGVDQFNWGEGTAAKLAEREQQRLWGQGQGWEQQVNQQNLLQRAGLLGGATQTDISQASAEDMNRLNALMSFLMPRLNLAQNLQGMRLGGVGGMANMLGGFQELVPQSNFLMDAFSAFMAANPPSMPGPKGSWQLGATYAGTGGNLGMGCIDGSCLIPTQHGPRPLRDVQVGDLVYDSTWRVRSVTAKDYGSVPDDQQHDHVAIGTFGGTIRLTKDHSIGGKRADQWEPGDTMTMSDGREVIVQTIGPADYVWSGDLALEGNADYIADGFVIQSTLGRQQENENGRHERVA